MAQTIKNDITPYMSFDQTYPRQVALYDRTHFANKMSTVVNKRVRKVLIFIAVRREGYAREISQFFDIRQEFLGFGVHLILLTEQAVLAKTPSIIMVPNIIAKPTVSHNAVFSDR